MWREKLLRLRKARYGAKYIPSYLTSSQSSLNNSRKVAKIAKIIFVFIVGSFLLGVAILPFLAFNLPAPDKIVRREGFSSKILDRNGEVLYDIFSEERQTPVALNQVPLYLRQATIATEDKNFYEHQGFDPVGYLRAFYYFVTGKRRLQGGSTLTQQLVKNVLLTNERSLIRKVKEFVITIQIERKYTKDEILQMYLNEAPYGSTARGVEAASEVYFGKNVGELGLTESAFLAGLPQRPSYYSPYSSDPKAYVPRTQGVLRRMREDGYISDEQEKQANEALETLAFLPKGASFKAPHFVQYVQKLLEDRYGAQVLEQGGLRVTTTLDISLQEKAQEIVADEISKAKKLEIGNGAAVVLDPKSGEILAMVGSYDFNATDYDGQVNVTTALRQPGSAIKPFTYVTALKKGYTPSTLLWDVPTVFPGGIGQPEYKPENYDGKYRGPVQMRFALGSSLNVPAVKMLAMVGIKEVLTTAHDFGLSTLQPNKQTLDRVGLSLTLGGGEVKLLELANAYSPFLNGGLSFDTKAILKIEDLNGKVLENIAEVKGKQVISPQIAYLMAHMLSDNKAREMVFGPNSLLNIAGKSVAVKTGTTNDKRDNWAIGGNQFAVVGSWVGNNDNSPMKGVASGVSGTSPIWRRILLETIVDKPNAPFDVPSDVEQMDVDTISGYKGHDGFATRVEYFVHGTAPDIQDPTHVKIKVCKNEGKLATPSDVASGNYDEKEFIVAKEEDPTAAAGQPNRWQEGILGWIATQNEPKYNPPTDFCGSPNPINVEFSDPKDRASNLPNNFKIKISADSTSDIAILELEIDGVKVRSFSGGPYEYDADLTSGVHTLRAKAIDAKGNQSDRVITIGVNTAWDASPTPAAP